MTLKKDYFSQKKQSNKLGALIVFLGVFVFLYSLFFPLYRLIDYLICLLITVLATFLFNWFLSGKFAASKPESTPQWAQPSGNPHLDTFLEDSKVLLTDLSLESERIADSVISSKTHELLAVCRQIFSTIEQQPAKLPQIRKFMNYYLPTTADLLRKHRILLSQQKDRLILSQSRSQVLQALDLIIPACEKQLRALYHNEILDMRVDVEVLQKMLKRDGYIPSEININHSPKE